MCCSGCLNLFLLADSCVQALRFYKRFEVLILPFTTHSSWLFVVNISIVHVQKPGKILYSLFPFMSFSPRVSLLRHSQKPRKIESCLPVRSRSGGALHLSSSKPPVILHVGTICINRTRCTLHVVAQSAYF